MPLKTVEGQIKELSASDSLKNKKELQPQPNHKGSLNKKKVYSGPYLLQKIIFDFNYDRFVFW